MNGIITDINKVVNNSLEELADIKKTSDEIKESISKFNYDQFNQQANEEMKSGINDLKGEITVKPPVNKIILRKLLKGDLCMANLGQNKQSILGGARPVIIVQNNLANKYAPSLTVVPVATTVHTNKKLPTHIQFDWNNQSNNAVIEQITTISKSDIIEFIEEVDSDLVSKINEALLFQLDIRE